MTKKALPKFKRVSPGMNGWAKFVKTSAQKVGKENLSRLAKVAAKGPVSGTQKLNAAKVVAKLGSTADAIGILSRSTPAVLDRDAILYLGYLLQKHKRFDEALAVYGDYSEATNQSEPDVELIYQQGRCFKNLGLEEEARASFSQAVALAPSEIRFRNALFDTYGSAPTWRKLELLEEGLQFGTDRAWSRKTAEFRFRMHQFDKAVDLYDKLGFESLEPNEILRMAESHFRLGNISEAKRLIETSKTTDVKNLGDLFQKQGIWKYVATARKSELTSKASPEDFHQAGFALLRAYRFSEAKPLLQAAISTQQTNPAWIYHFGLCCEKLGDFSTALDAYLTAYSAGASDYHLYRALYVEREVANGDKATRVLAQVLHSKFNVSEEFAVLTEGPEDSDFPRSNRMSGIVRALATRNAQNGYVKEAESDFEWLCDTASSLVPSDYEYLAYLYLSQGKKYEAREAFLSKRDFRTAHGLDVSKYNRRRDYNAMLFAEMQEELPLDESKVLYESNHGGKLTCNVLPILRENLKSERGKRQRHVVVANQGVDIPSDLQRLENVVFVERDSYAYVKHLATSGWLVNNNTFAPYFSRREGQNYLNTWHGTPLKTLGKDIKSGTMDHRNAARNFLHCTHMIFPNQHTLEVLIDRYDIDGLYKGKAALTGYPRIDVQFTMPDEEKKMLRREIGARADERILLYAPTWRGTLAEKSFDTEKLKDDLRELSKLDCKVIFQPHPLMLEQIQGQDLPVDLPPVGVDTNEILAVTDILVTDYSSIFFDYYPLNRPVFLYAYDRKEYFAERGSYFAMEELPGKLVGTIDDLISSIRDTLMLDSPGLHESAIPANEFVQKEDGKATDRALQFFFENDDSNVVQGLLSHSARPELLFFQGSFLPNGITSSFLNLSHNLVAEGRVNQTVVLQPEAVFGDEQRVEKFRQLDDEVRVIGRVGSPAFRPEEEWLIKQYNLCFEFSSKEHEAIYFKAFQREFRRIFGEASFDSHVCFEGYARFWASLLGTTGADGNNTSKSIFMHSDMNRERVARFPYLQSIFNIYSHFDKFASVSDSVSSENIVNLAEEFDIPTNSFFTVENSIDSDQISLRANEELDVELEKGMKYFCATGRLTREKGHDLLLSAFEIVYAHDRNTRLLLVGDGPLIEEYRVWVNQRGLSGAVIFTGYKENPLPIVRACDCFVFPSRYEGQGLSLIEALALGKPSIGCDVVGVRSVLANGEGLLVAPTVEGIAEGMIRFLEGRFNVQNQFDARAYEARAMEQFYSLIS